MSHTDSSSCIRQGITRMFSTTPSNAVSHAHARCLLLRDFALHRDPVPRRGLTPVTA
jgi:hypothetical protein